MKTRNLPRAAALLAALTLTLSVPALAAEGGMGNFQRAASGVSFPDVPADAWYAADVQTAVELGIMNGRSDGGFDPLGSLTLAEAVTMAAKARSIYEGGGFTPGGTPWYQNAVNYAEEMGIILDGEYMDYTQPATKADMAGMFAFALPDREYPRINRVASIPDVNGWTPYVDYIYQLYSAGILTGDGGGAFHPDEYVTRCEAAAILNRVALPGSRKTFSMDQPAPGTVVSSYDGTSFRLSLPDGWVYLGPPGEGSFSQGCYIAGTGMDSVQFQVLRYLRSEVSASDLGSFAEGYMSGVMYGVPEMEYEEEPRFGCLRGLHGYYLETGRDTPDHRRNHYQVWCLENSMGYYVVIQTFYGDTPDELWEQSRDLLYSLDLAL